MSENLNDYQTKNNPFVGQVLQNRYLVLSILGSGGMGAVYQARDMHFPNVNKMVAVKVIEVRGHDNGARQRLLDGFRRESELLAATSHPAIPIIYDSFVIENTCFLVMEYINGQTLEQLLEQTDELLPVLQVIEWAIQTCDVLAYLHSLQPYPVIFRDLKPANLMLDQYRRIRLIDFGIARYFQLGNKSTMVGTEGYAPPEQYRGEVGPVGDIYALGASLHHLLTKNDPRNEPPFTFDAHPIRNYNPAVPVELELIIYRALNYEATDRFPSAEAMREALRELQTRMLANPDDFQKMNDLQHSIGGVQGAQPKPIWMYPCGDEIRSQPLVVGETVYVAVYDSQLYALNRRTGATFWRYSAAGGFAASPVLGFESLYIGSEDTNFYAISALNGRQAWRFTTGAAIRGSARIFKEQVMFGSDDGYLYVLSARFGRLLWEYKVGTPVRSRPAVSESGWVYFGTDRGKFLCVRAPGELVWQFDTSRAIISSPLLRNDLVVFGSMDNNIYALERKTGWLVWQFQTDKPIVSSPTHDPDLSRLFIGSADRKLYALDLETGEVQWMFETEGQIASSPTYYKGRVYFGSVDQHVYCVNASNGALIWKYKTKGAVISSPAVDRDVVYVGSIDYYVYALPV